MLATEMDAYSSGYSEALKQEIGKRISESENYE